MPVFVNYQFGIRDYSFTGTSQHLSERTDCIIRMSGTSTLVDGLVEKYSKLAFLPESITITLP